MRVLLDTNVLIAAFITRGVCSDVFDHCIRHHELVISEFILDEFQKNMILKFRYRKEETDEAIELLRSKIKLVRPVIIEKKICRDTNDIPILGTAIAGNVNCIITGDKDLLSIKRFRSIDIVSPAEFSNYEVIKQSE